eukprot:m.214166 g.214166  ORF g.214166 m.214166 type:complete len:153 (-) comp17186_c1_seq1:561-1019(-)
MAAHDASESTTTAEATYEELLADQSQWFTVEPRKDCPHVTQVAPVLDFELSQPCGDCGHLGENWVCLTCSQVGCSRYVNEHMLQHCQSVEHPIAFSFSDFSYWCFSCNDYVVSPLFKPITKAATTMKFGSIEEEDDASASTSTAAMDVPSLD